MYLPVISIAGHSFWGFLRLWVLGIAGNSCWVILAMWVSQQILLSVSQWVTTWLATQRSDPLGGPGWASELPQRVGPLCTNPVGSMHEPVQNTTCFCKTQSSNVLICFIGYLDSRDPNQQQISHKMLSAVSISLPFQSFCSPLRPKSPDYDNLWVSNPLLMISNWNSRGPWHSVLAVSWKFLLCRYARLAAAPKIGRRPPYTPKQRNLSS